MSTCWIRRAAQLIDRGGDEEWILLHSRMSKIQPGYGARHFHFAFQSTQ